MPPVEICHEWSQGAEPPDRHPERGRGILVSGLKRGLKHDNRDSPIVSAEVGIILKFEM